MTSKKNVAGILVAAVVIAFATYRLVQQADAGRDVGIPLGSTPAAQLKFRLSLNAVGDRIMLSAPVQIESTPQPSGPDRVRLLTNISQPNGGFMWTAIPSRGSDQRLIGEIAIGSKVYKMCEMFHGGSNSIGTISQRFDPVNNGGERARLPTGMASEPMLTLYAALNDAGLPAKAVTSTDNVTLEKATSHVNSVDQPAPDPLNALANRVALTCLGE